MSKGVLFMFSSKSFRISTLTFRTLIHFQFIFVYGVMECSNFIFLCVALQFSQPHLLKVLPFLHIVYFCLSCYRLIDCKGLSLFVGFLPASLAPVCVLLPVPYCLDYSVL